jgi:hypothetical protein
MNAITSSSLELSPSELFTLASLMGGEMLLGIPDPFPGWLTEEIMEAMEAARQKMAERGLLALLSDGRIMIDSIVAALIWPIVTPQVVLLLTREAPNQPSQQISFYYRSPLIVAVEVHGERWNVYPLPDRASLSEQIRKTWQLSEQQGADAEPFSLAEDALQAALQALPSEEEACRLLEEAGVPPATARSAARTLITPRQNGALVVIRRRAELWQTEGIGILEGENGLWLLRSLTRRGHPWVEFAPCPASEVIDEIDAILDRFLPPEER